MDWQAGFNVAVMIVGGLGGALLKSIWDTLAALRADMQTLSQSVNANARSATETYMRRDDFSAAEHRIEAAINRGFDRLESRIESKADKP